MPPAVTISPKMLARSAAPCLSLPLAAISKPFADRHPLLRYACRLLALNQVAREREARTLPSTGTGQCAWKRSGSVSSVGRSSSTCSSRSENDTTPSPATTISSSRAPTTASRVDSTDRSWWLRVVGKMLDRGGRALLSGSLLDGQLRYGCILGRLVMSSSANRFESHPVFGTTLGLLSDVVGILLHVRRR